MKNQSNEKAIKNFLKEYPEIFTPREQYQILKIICWFFRYYRKRIWNRK